MAHLISKANDFTQNDVGSKVHSVTAPCTSEHEELEVPEIK